MPASQPVATPSSLSITGLGALSALGANIASHHRALLARQVPFRKLGELLGADSPHAARPGAWIERRSLLVNRKWSPATMAALHVAREAIAEAGWTAEELRDAALVVGTSRGNAAGWLGPWPGRRPFKLMAASNTIHSEPASAITIEFGITGPNHVLASGCAAGLDAIGIAMMLVRSGAAPRALAVAVGPMSARHSAMAAGVDGGPGLGGRACCEAVSACQSAMAAGVEGGAGLGIQAALSAAVGGCAGSAGGM